MSLKISNNEFPIKSDVARKVWNSFERELVHKLKPLPEAERVDVRLEILSHLYDSAANDQAGSEELNFINAIDRLGDPDDYLTPLVSDILLSQKTRKGNPSAILKSMFISARRGMNQMFAIMLLSFCYFVVMLFFVMGFMHTFNPDVGLWFYPGGGYSLSFQAQPDATQWLPQWFSLLAIIGSVIGYWLLNKILALLLKKTSS